MKKEVSIKKIRRDAESKCVCGAVSGGELGLVNIDEVRW